MVAVRHSVLLLAMTLCLTAVVTVINGDTSSDLDPHWETFKTLYHKKYNNENDEESLRRIIWESNLKFIQNHNLEQDLGLHSYTLAMNEFGDLTQMEYRQRYFSHVSHSHSPREPQPNHHRRYHRVRHERNHLIFEDEIMRRVNSKVSDDGDFDWRDKGVVTPVKDQVRSQCKNAGWSFAATGSVESQYAIKTQRLISMSEQELIDCSRPWGTGGCSRGEVNQAFNYVISQGLASEDDYRYRATDTEQCYAGNVTAVTRCSQILTSPQSEERLYQDLVKNGPIAATIDASHDSFRFYSGGVYDEDFCSTTNLNHGVLIVGSGHLNAVPYWIVKNSFGTGWGKYGGYIYMSKDKNNQCGIASRASVCLI